MPKKICTPVIQAIALQSMPHASICYSEAGTLSCVAVDADEIDPKETECACF